MSLTESSDKQQCSNARGEGPGIAAEVRASGSCDWNMFCWSRGAKSRRCSADFILRSCLSSRIVIFFMPFPANTRRGPSRFAPAAALALRLGGEPGGFSSALCATTGTHVGRSSSS